MTLSTHRVIQLSMTLDRLEDLPGKYRRCASNLARIRNRLGAIEYTSRAQKAERLLWKLRDRLADDEDEFRRTRQLETLKAQVNAIDWRELEVRGEYEELFFKRSGISAVVCTGYAAELFCIFGPKRTMLFGFHGDDNPTSRIGREYGGHDFAVIDDRYVVDPWLDDTANESKQVVFDLEAPDDQPIIQELYGDRRCWKRNFDLERELTLSVVKL